MDLAQLLMAGLGLVCTFLLGWIGAELRLLRGMVGKHGERLARLETQLDVFPRGEGLQRRQADF
jgi:hypothetical protein